MTEPIDVDTGAGPRVLVLEDEALVCDLVVEALQDEGVETLCANDPATALELLASHRATLRVILTDVNLGAAMDGFEVAREARRLIPDIFVLYATGYAEADFATRSVPGAMIAPKPFALHEVASRIAALARVVGTY